MTTDEKRDALACRDIDILTESDLLSIMIDGCTGYKNMTIEEIDDLYTNLIEE